MRGCITGSSRHTLITRKRRYHILYIISLNVISGKSGQIKTHATHRFLLEYPYAARRLLCHRRSLDDRPVDCRVLLDNLAALDVVFRDHLL